MSRAVTHIREANADDGPALQSLLETREQRMLLKDAVAARFGSFDSNVATTWVAEEDGKIVGMSTTLLRTLHYGQREVRAGYWTDLFILPEYRKHMLYAPLTLAMLRGAQARGMDAVYTANRRREVWEAHMRLGCRLAGAAPTRVKVLKPVAAAARYWNAPSVFESLTAPFDATFQRLRSRPSVADVELIPLEPTERNLESVCSALRKVSARTLHQRWTPMMLAERMHTNLENEPYRLVVAKKRDTSLGFVLYRLAERDRIRLGVLMDAVFDCDAMDAGQVLRAIEGEAASHGAQVMLALDGCADLHDVLSTGGYMVSPEWYVFLVWPAEKVVDSWLGNASQWRFSFADHDAF